MKKILILITIFLCCTAVYADGFSNYITGLKYEAKREGFSNSTVNEAFDHVQLLPRARYQNKYQTQVIYNFPEYLAVSVTPERIELGKQNRWRYRVLLGEISQQYQVPEQYIVALWGLETNYGQVTGDFSEFSALATLAYNSGRPRLFRSEIFAALRMLQQHQLPLDKMYGSWAGAMGQCQFMPSAYLLFAVPYHHAGAADIWDNQADIFASIANYLHQEGWNEREGLVFPVKLERSVPSYLIGFRTMHDMAYWLAKGVVSNAGQTLANQQGYYSLLFPAGVRGSAYLVNVHNFRVIMRWNDSTFYALSIGDLANHITQT